MTNKKEKISKEMEELLNAIEKWHKKYKGNVQFVGNFVAFKNDDFDIAENRLIAFGFKDLLRDDLKFLDEIIDNEKEEFVNF